jgi:hypothetical protein
MKDECGRMNRATGTEAFSFILPTSSLRLVDLARFERATSTFAESRSDSAELQVRKQVEGIKAEA